MAKKTLPATTKLRNYLLTGKTITPQGAVNKCGFSGVDAVYQAIYNMRQEGMNIETDRTPKGTVYSI